MNSVDEARRLPTEVLIKANAMVESELPYFGLSPFRDAFPIRLNFIHPNRSVGGWRLGARSPVSSVYHRSPCTGPTSNGCT